MFVKDCIKNGFYHAFQLPYLIGLLFNFHINDFHVNFQTHVIFPGLERLTSMDLILGAPGSQRVFLRRGVTCLSMVGIFCRECLPRVLGEWDVGFTDQLLTV